MLEKAILKLYKKYDSKTLWWIFTIAAADEPLAVNLMNVYISSPSGAEDVINACEAGLEASSRADVRAEFLIDLLASITTEEA